jgi:hypothetical protein
MTTIEQATTPDRKIQHERVYGLKRPPTLIVQEHYDLLGTTVFWYGSPETICKHRYTVAYFRVRYKNLN